jgi:hypothetical protein
LSVFKNAISLSGGTGGPTVSTLSGEEGSTPSELNTGITSTGNPGESRHGLLVPIKKVKIF